MGVGTSYSSSSKNLHSISRGQTLLIIGILTSSALAGGFLYETISGSPEQPAARNHFFSVVGLGISEDAQDAYTSEPATHTAIATSDMSSGSAQQSSSNTDVQVNGQSIAVPGNGQVHKVIKQEGGQTVVDISSNSSNSSYSTKININSNSSSHGQ